MVSFLAILLGLSVTLATCDAMTRPITVHDEGLACNDMASALPKLQNLTGTHILLPNL